MDDKINGVFAAQQQNKFLLRTTDAEVRIAKLNLLKQAIKNFEEEIFAALQSDLRKCRFESAVTEVLFIYSEIDHAIKKLKGWMRPRGVSRTISNLFSGNKIYYEPKGVCLIIAPWNYPFQLLMSPLVSAIAAGNCAMLKPSELSPAVAGICSKLIAQTFDPKEIACFEGDTSIATALLKLPFDHIFFTGSTAVGKVVMEAAAKHLSSVTLELGGKSPVIIDHSADVKDAARKIAWGKLVNAGQTCIAPDYVLIAEELEKEFVTSFKASVEQLFFNQGELNLTEYAKIINQKHFDRLKGLLHLALQAGARLEWGGQTTAENLTIHPTILTAVEAENPIMAEEIFGPILPVITYKNLQEAIDFINKRDKPLALYVFSNSAENQNKIIRETSAGGSCINDVLIHISNPNLPFGGVGSSGMGSCHGIYGFKSFSHEKAVVFQSRLGLTKLIYPPYHQKMGLLKWLEKIL
ncbi:aldehyde dehydrogenase family protein [Pedobacter rhizosphaerae]|uniref:Aldehyde dehydrogenase n=1 Tax=Pedobacter rhizosphaerae TaxID=390241 RepID=A0A1H9IZ25_9SPHI|nr:aldehyde dehydrogenase family protein [Pedobacter rhizosphaerae]SEQ79850.1 aldehyde dehydrogenase (NAD+) [Pedobacter rhizosphaerae]